MSDLIRGRFNWVEGLRKGLVFLLDDSIHPYFEVSPTSDPLTAFLTISLQHRLPKASRDPMRTYIRAWASTEDCEVPKIDIDARRVLAVVLFKYRHPRGKIRDAQEWIDRRPG